MYYTDTSLHGLRAMTIPKLNCYLQLKKEENGEPYNFYEMMRWPRAYERMLSDPPIGGVFVNSSRGIRREF